MEFCDFLVPLTSFGPWQSHIGPPSAPSCPKAASYDDIWAHFGELILGIVGVFLVLAGFRSRAWTVRAGSQNQKQLFHIFWGLPQGAQEVSRCGGSSVFTLAASGKHCRLLAPFGRDLGDPKAKLYSRWGLLESIFGGKLGVSFCR